jgi:hypothetical protein
MSMDQLRGRLDDAFSAVSPVSAPIEGAIRKGKMIRLRRRAVAAAGIAAVVAAGIFTPLAVQWQSAGPVTTNYTVTVQPPGPHSPAGEIAWGTVDGKTWQIVWEKPCRWNDEVNGGISQCILDLGAPFAQDDVVEGTGGLSLTPNYGLSPSSVPVNFQGNGGGVLAAAWVGAVSNDVSSVAVRLNNGTVLTLDPVMVHGVRSVAFAEPVGATIVNATAYSQTGEISTATPFILPNGATIFAAWLRPGQRGHARVTGLIVDDASGSASAYLGPWGTCIADVSKGGSVSSCNGHGGSSILPWLQGAWSGDTIGSAPQAATKIVFKWPDGRTVTVHTVAIGGEKFFAVPPFPKPYDWAPWTTYNAAGQVIATGGHS